MTVWYKKEGLSLWVLERKWSNRVITVIMELPNVIMFTCLQGCTENVKNFEWLSNKNMPISQTEGYFGNPNYHLLEGRTYAFSVGKNSNFAVKVAKRSNVSYFIYLMNHLVQTLYSLRRTLMAETIFATESLLKMMKSTFYFTTKTLFVLKILSFCLDFLVM